MNGQKKVLVVDDEPDIRDGVTHWMQAAGHSTLQAVDGVQGVASARAHMPHAIVLDMLMPNKDGLETLADLRTHEETVNIPVVMLSASLRDEQKALDAGARFFVHKPYNGKKLLSAINVAMAQ